MPRGIGESASRGACDLARGGPQFCAPKVLGALSRAVDENDERAQLLAEGEDLLHLGAVGHNHLWFYRDAIEAMLSAADLAGVLHYVSALEDYTRREPLPWAELFAARGRALARTLQASADEAVRCELERVRSLLLEAGFRHYLAAVDAALTA
jgi:hypothetical protein